jgi:hypothetical protein
MWLIRHGKHFYLQPISISSVVVIWGDRFTARLFSSEAEAQCFADALGKTGCYWGYCLVVEQLQPDFTNIPLELLVQLQSCARTLVAPPQDKVWQEFWKTAALQAADSAQDFIMDSISVPTKEAIEIDTDLLQDLQQCALKVAIPAEEAIAAVADFAQKTLVLSEPYIQSWVSE